MSTNTEKFNLKEVIADYLQDGFLDNIIDMFKQDKKLYEYIGELMSDKRFRVRLGVSALIETLRTEDSDNITRAIPYIIPLLKDKNPMLRGDAAHLLGLIGSTDVIPFLKERLQDEYAHIRDIAKDAIEEIESKISP